jgi:hypothetical protein
MTCIFTPKSVRSFKQKSKMIQLNIFSKEMGFKYALKWIRKDEGLYNKQFFTGFFCPNWDLHKSKDKGHNDNDIVDTIFDKNIYKNNIFLISVRNRGSHGKDQSVNIKG